MNIITREFEGHAVHTFEWNGKPCWIANEIVALFGYADTSKTIRQCIDAEDFELGIEYDVLRGTALREFKTQIEHGTTAKVVPSRISQLSIFYEDGLYGFLQYSEKPVGVRFRKWVRREVVPAVRQTGTYAMGNAEPPQGKKALLKPRHKDLPSLPSLNNTARIMLKVMVDAKVPEHERLKILADMYKQAGVHIEIPNMMIAKPSVTKSDIFENEFRKLKSFVPDLTQSELDDDLKEIMSADVSSQVKLILLQMITAAHNGKELHFN